MENQLPKPSGLPLTQAREVCQKCQLYQGCQTPFMPGRGNPNQPKLAIVGEAPGADEDMRGEPFVGRSGELVNNLIRDYGLQEGDFYITNAVRCRPPDNKIADKCLKACREFMLDDLLQVQPKAIIVLGNSPMFSLLGRRGITSDRGKIFDWHGVPVVAAYHPAYILRNPSASDALVDDFGTAWEIAITGIVPKADPVSYRVVRTEKDLFELEDEVAAAEWVAWDIETTSLDAFAENASVVCVQISTKTHSGWLLPFNHKERDEGKVDVSIEQLKSHVRLFLELSEGPLVAAGKKLCGQNLKFDMGYLRANLGISPRTPAFDAYIAHHLLFEEESTYGGNGLKRMAWKFTDMGGYESGVEDAFPNFYQRMHEVPLEPVDPEQPTVCLMHYACGDTDVTMRVMQAMWPMLEKENLLKTLKLELKKQDLLVNMEHRGAAIDWEFHGEMMEAFPAQQQRIAEQLRTYPEVQEVEKLYPSTRAGGEAKHKPVPFNANSSAQVRLLCYNVMGLPQNEKFVTDKGELSTKSAVVLWWLAKLPAKCAAREIIELIVQGKRTAKLYGTYIRPLPELKGRDGKIHTRYNQGRAVTSRLTSENPNLQNLPRDDEKLREGWVGKGNIKRLYVGAQPGWWVAEHDYSQIELRIAALISQDPVMLKNYLNGEDLHTRTAVSVYKQDLAEFEARLELDDPEVKRMRSAAKIINFGIIYGMQGQALAEKIGESPRVADRMIESYFNTYRGLHKWFKNMREFVKEHGYVEGLFGHRRHLPNVRASDKFLREEAFRQAGNFPIQNTASCLTTYAMMFADRLMIEDRMQSLIFGNVHDSIWSSGPEEEKDTAPPLIQWTMENTGFDFLTGKHPDYPVVPPILADAKIGYNLRDLKKA